MTQISDFRFQIWILGWPRFQISDFRFQISDLDFGMTQISDFRFQIWILEWPKFHIPDLRFHVWILERPRVQIADFRFGILERPRFQISDFRFGILRWPKTSDIKFHIFRSVYVSLSVAFGVSWLSDSCEQVRGEVSRKGCVGSQRHLDGLLHLKEFAAEFWFRSPNSAEKFMQILNRFTKIFPPLNWILHGQRKSDFRVPIVLVPELYKFRFQIQNFTNFNSGGM